MEDLMDTQIKDSCRLALPEGLKELMADISREVLRAQPANLYQFIADYLSALLVTREHLSIAARVCGDVCDNICHPALDDELREIGLSEEDIVKAVEAVRKFVGSGDSKEDNLMMELIKKTDISEYQLPSVVKVVREAYLRHRLAVQLSYEKETDTAVDDVTRAVQHTMNIHKKSAPSEHQKCVMAQKIQAAYRAYKVRRSMSKDQQFELPKQNRMSISSGKSIRFDSEVENEANDDTQELEPDHQEVLHKFIKTVSSASLAGSFLKLHHSKPYSAIDHDLEEKQERVHTYNEIYNDEDTDKKKQIGFHNTQETIDDEADFADDDSEISVPDESKSPECDEVVEEKVDEIGAGYKLNQVQSKTSSRNVMQSKEKVFAKNPKVVHEEDDEDHFYV